VAGFGTPMGMRTPMGGRGSLVGFDLLRLCNSRWVAVNNSTNINPSQIWHDMAMAMGQSRIPEAQTVDVGQV